MPFFISEDGSLSSSLMMLIVILLVVLYAFIGNFLEHKHFHYIHETGVGILLGFIFALSMWLIKGITNYQFNQQIFFFGLLPPMIFSGGYNLKKSLFFKNFLYISLYGIFGTVITFGIIFGLTFAINKLQLIRNKQSIDKVVTLSVSLMVKYSATICASDSVAALTMINPSKYPKLFSIIFGQGMINDAVSIILFRVVGPLFDRPKEEDENVGFLLLNIVGQFLLNVVCSFLIGSICAMFCSLIFKKMRFLSDNSIAEVTLMYMFGILSYVVAEQLNMSGVITVLVCGICLAHFNFYNLSITGQISTGVTFQTVSFLAEALVFIYLGVCTVTYATNYYFSYTFLLIELVICLIARFGTIFGLSYFVKLFKKNWNLSFYELIIISVAGAIRGSVAFALILTLKDPKEQKSIQILQSSVFIMVFITTVILGALMPTIITKCIKKDKKLKKQQPLLQKQQKNINNQQPLKGFKKFDQQYLKPLFIYNYNSRKTQIMEFKRTLKLNSPQYTGGQFKVMLIAAQQSHMDKQSSHNLSPKQDKGFEQD